MFDPIKPMGTSIKPIQPQMMTETIAPKENVEGFGNMFSTAFSNANKAMWYAGQLGREIAQGGNVEMHEVSIAGQKAKIALHLTTQLTTKITQACSQIFQMQI